jgi:hypothetical protein
MNHSYKFRPENHFFPEDSLADDVKRDPEPPDDVEESLPLPGVNYRLTDRFGERALEIKLPYKTDSVALSAEDLDILIRDLKRFRERMGEPPAETRVSEASEFILWNPDSDLPPRIRFGTRDHATMIASSMAARYQSKFYVAKLVTEVAPPTVTVLDITVPDNAGPFAEMFEETPSPNPFENRGVPEEPPKPVKKKAKTKKSKKKK